MFTWSARQCRRYASCRSRAATTPLTCVHHAVCQAGVYAVRAGPILLHNLVAYCTGGELRAYKPQRDFLKLLCTGDGNAVGTHPISKALSLSSS